MQQRTHPGPACLPGCSYQLKLQNNLMMLASVADTQPNPNPSSGGTPNLQAQLAAQINLPPSPAGLARTLPSAMTTSATAAAAQVGCSGDGGWAESG